MITAVFLPVGVEIQIKEEQVSVLVLENKKMFRDVLHSFTLGSEDDVFTFSEDFKPFEFAKKGFFIADPINPDLNNKKVINKINDYLTSVAVDEYPQETARINADIVDLAEKLLSFSDFEFTYDNCDVDALSIIKMLSFHLDCCDQSPCEVLVSYLILLNKYLKYNFFVIANMHIYFSVDELEKMYETLRLNHISLLLTEQSLAENCDCENVFIVDSDLCLIDKSGD